MNKHVELFTFVVNELLQVKEVKVCVIDSTFDQRPQCSGRLMKPEVLSIMLFLRNWF